MYHGERFNSVTHVTGAALAIAGTVALLCLATLLNDVWKIVSFGVYGATLVLLYTFSALYHSLRGKAKAVFRKLDHCAIYFMIAGTYTPFALVTLRGAWGWSLLVLAWLMAAIGLVQELFCKSEKRLLSLIIYVLMGWMAIGAAKPLIDALGYGGFAWLAAGGALYTAGIAFYAVDERVTHAHGVWHLFVLGGTAAHYGAILFYVA
jgi:hemolysin III